MLNLPNIGAGLLGDHLDHDLMFTFFAAFARFEYALKAVGFLRAVDYADPAWKGFAGEIERRFADACDEDRDLRSAVDALLKDPPKRQMQNGDWLPIPVDEERVWYVLQLVKQVRNNLFHGGKAQRQAGDGDRDNRLVKSALVVLDRALACHDRVRERFVEV